MTPEDEEFNRVEMESRIKQDYVRDIKQPSREQALDGEQGPRGAIRCRRRAPPCCGC